MNKEFIPYELALELKELGFDVTCFKYWRNRGFDMKLKDLYTSNLAYQDFKEKECTAPLWQQAFDWFRIKHFLYTEVSIVRPEVYRYFITSKDNFWEGYKEVGENGYHKVRVELLKKLIDIVKESK